MVANRSSYPATQYLIERYYESMERPLPVGPHLCDHRSSGELLRAIKGDSVGAKERNPIENGDVVCDEAGSITKMTLYLKSLLMGSDYDNDLKIENLVREKNNAISYDQWNSTSHELDERLEKNKWKLDPVSDLYDYELIVGLTKQLKENRLNNNYSKLLYLIRTHWVRNFGNINNLNLYKHCNVGTKQAIEDYLTESELTIEALLNQSELDINYLLGIFQQTRRNIGKSALVLSGGATFGLFHIGVIAALFEADLMPRVISGTSAGAIVASIFCAHTTDEIPSLLTNVLDMEFNIFRDNKDTTNSDDFLMKFSRLLKHGTWFDNKHLANTMISFLGNLTFREAYYRTGKILNITVSPASMFEQPRLLNNLTAPNVLVWSAVCASCSVPGVFPATPLYEKDPKTGENREWSGSSSVKFVDGSVDNDLPISRLSEMFNVDHIIACQVNVHVFPFLKFSLSCVGGELQNEFSAQVKKQMASVYNFVSDELIHILEMSGEMGLAPNITAKLRSILSQRYSGDITILPHLKMLGKAYELLNNPTREFLLHETTCGARATWPKLSMIRNNCGQEFALERAITLLKGKIIVNACIKNPLQFIDNSFKLIKLTDDKKFTQHNDIPDLLESEEGHTRSILDDELVEPENTKALLFIPNSHLKRDGRLRSLSLRLNPEIVHPIPYKEQTYRLRASTISPKRSRMAGISQSFSAINSPLRKARRKSSSMHTNRVQELFTTTLDEFKNDVGTPSIIEEKIHLPTINNFENIDSNPRSSSSNEEQKNLKFRPAKNS